jgi:hypothetical protein
MISIAFGAPPLCDAKAATLVNDNPDFKWRFVNFVNQMDLVPRLLQRYPPDSAELQKFHRDISMPNNIQAASARIRTSKVGAGLLNWAITIPI